MSETNICNNLVFRFIKVYFYKPLRHYYYQTTINDHYQKILIPDIERKEFLWHGDNSE